MVYVGPAEHNVVTGIRGIYLGPKGRAVGPLHGTVQGQPITVEAKAGFAVSGLGVKAYGDAVQRFQVFFMRIAPGAAASIRPISTSAIGSAGSAVRRCSIPGMMDAWSSVSGRTPAKI